MFNDLTALSFVIFVILFCDRDLDILLYLGHWNNWFLHEIVITNIYAYIRTDNIILKSLKQFEPQTGNKINFEDLTFLSRAEFMNVAGIHVEEIVY